MLFQDIVTQSQISLIDTHAKSCHLDGMTQYRFFLTNMATPIIDVAAETLWELTELMERRRFLFGTAVDVGGSGQDLGVVVSTSGIRMVSEVGFE